MNFFRGLEAGEISKTPEIERGELLKKTTVYVNAGGRGTRLESLLPKDLMGVQKALLEFNGKPMVQNHADLLLQLGFKNVIIGAGDHYNIKEYFRDKESEKLHVANTETQEDTGGDLIKAVRDTENLGENVLVENVDTLLYLKNLRELLLQHEKSKAIATIVLTTQKGVPNEGAFFVDQDGKVIFSEEAGEEHGLERPVEWSGFRGSSTGVIVFKSDFLTFFDWQSGSGQLSIYKDIVPALIKAKGLHAYNNGDNFFVDIGTPEAYKRIKRHDRRIFGALGDRYTKQK